MNYEGGKRKRKSTRSTKLSRKSTRSTKPRRQRRPRQPRQIEQIPVQQNLGVTIPVTGKEPWWKTGLNLLGNIAADYARDRYNTHLATQRSLKEY